MGKELREKKFRIVLSELELRWLHILLVGQYHCDRSNLRYDKRRIKNGAPDSRVYPVREREEHLKETAKLLRKLSRPIKVKWFIR